MNWYKKTKLAVKKEYLIQKLGIPIEIVEWADSLAKQIEPKGKYNQWISQLGNEKKVIPGEDNSKIIEKLTLFEKLQKLKKIPHEILKFEDYTIKDPNNINSFRSYGDLTKFLERFKDEEVESKRGKEKRMEMEGAESIYNQNGVEILKLTTPEAVSHWCRGTEWCVKDPKFFNEYGPPFYEFLLNREPYALMHTESGSFKDKYDNGLNRKQISKIADGIDFLIQNKIFNPKNDNGDFYQVSGFLKTKEILNRLAVSNDPKYRQELDRMLNNKLNYFSLKEENRTPEIKQKVIQVWNQDLQSQIDEWNFCLEEGGRSYGGEDCDDLEKQLLEDYGILPEDIENNLDKSIKEEILEAAMNDIRRRPFSYRSFPENIKKKLDPQWVKEVFNKELFRNYGWEYIERLPDDVRNMYSDEEILNIYEQNLINIISTEEGWSIDDQWERMPEEIKNRFSNETKKIVAEYSLKTNLEKRYHTIGMKPTLPFELYPFVPREGIIEMWKSFAIQFPNQYFDWGIIPEDIKKEIPEKEIAEAYYRWLEPHPEGYSDIHPDAKKYIDPNIIKRYVLNDIIGNGIKSHTLFKIDAVKDIITEAEIAEALRERVYRDPSTFNEIPEQYKKYFTLQDIAKVSSEKIYEELQGHMGVEFTINSYSIDILQLLDSKIKNIISEQLNDYYSTNIQHNHFKLPTEKEKMFLSPEILQVFEKQQMPQQQGVIASIMNWYKILKFAQQERIINVTGQKMYLGKYPKITFKIEPEIPYSLIKYIIGDIRRDISDRVNNGEKWLLKIMSAMKKKYGSGDITWLMFNRFKDGTFWVDPYYAGFVSDKFLNLGYNSAKLGGFENKGVEEGSLFLDGNITPEGITIQIKGRLPGYLKAEIKKLKFWGEKIGNNFYWNRNTNNIKEQLVVLEQLFNIEEFNSQSLKNNTINYYSNLFSQMNIIELLTLKNELVAVSGFVQDNIKSLIDKYINIDTQTGEIVKKNYELV